MNFHKWISSCSPFHNILNLMAIFVCVYYLFNDVATSSDSITSNGKLISKWRLGKYVEGSGRGLTWDSVLQIAWRDWGKYRNPAAGWCPDRHSNRDIPNALLFEPTLSVTSVDEDCCLMRCDACGLVPICQTTRHDVQDGSHVRSHRRENLSSHSFCWWFIKPQNMHA
jgi:hypothetical protein